jgi:ribonuclease-3
VNVLRKKLRRKDLKLRRDIIKILGFRPKDLSLYILALTHKSVRNRPETEDYGNNERLEFLGDAVLDTIVSELLYKRFPSADEGFLTDMRTKIVNGKKLAEIAREMGLNKLLFANAGKNPSYRIYEDALEAFIGAIYVDKGYKYAKRFVNRRLFVRYIDLNELKHENNNYKSRLIEWSQKKKAELRFITHEELEEADLFCTEVLVDDHIWGTGKAGSKKAAEQIAAQEALKRITD